LWPTAKTKEPQRQLTNGRNISLTTGEEYQVGLEQMARIWPTARAEDSESCGNHPGATDSSTGATRNWRTPDAPSGGGMRSHQTSMGNGHQITIAEQAEHWQTPGTDSFRSRGGDRQNEMGLDQQARFFPMPAARDYRTPNQHPYQDRGGRAKGEQLQNFVEHHWPTPAACSPNSFRGKGQNPEKRKTQGHTVDLQDAVSVFSLPGPPIPDGPTSSPPGQTSRRRLNPRFVEWLMGFPVGWTELCETAPSVSADSAMPLCPTAPNGSAAEFWSSRISDAY
jgi:hypothetical protein